MSAMQYVFGASPQEAFYVSTFRHLADAVEAGLLNLSSFEAKDDLSGKVLRIKLEFEEVADVPVPAEEMAPE